MDNLIASLRQQLNEAILYAVEESRERGELTLESIPEFVLEIPREKAHGDFATNIAMLLTRQARKAPRQIAETLLPYLQAKLGETVTAIEVAGPGFINFRLNPRWLQQVVPLVLNKGADYGRTQVGGGKKVQVEFVSANPTGLLHMGNARGAALGDTIAALLDFSGHTVTREFYINDAGNQIENFGKSLEARYLQLLGQDVEFPEEGYHGRDIIETMQKLIDQEGDKWLTVAPAERRAYFIQFGLKEKLGAIKTVLERFGVHYDVWFSEQSLHDSGAVTNVIEELRQKGYIYEEDGALWFKATAFGDDKDEVVVRKNGVPTYFAADIAYHKNKFDRGFERVINIWGADHHGHVARMKGAMAALGYDPDKLDVVIMQLVRLFKGGEIVRMSKRSGEFVTLEDLIEEVGVDAARYFFIMRSADSHLDFDLDLARTQSSENPVYYVQYAHARICSILRQVEEKGLSLPAVEKADFACLQQPEEQDLLKKLAELPDEIAYAAINLEPHLIARYAHELAAAFHSFYNHCRVIGEEEKIYQARVLLVKATQIALANTLRLLGVTAPERM
ncbi:arginyl-tRNA synthetase [Carboxydocella sporoproducens DSM 16521]|uniref:Arginine--tRNA ligase n=2 Tax=Carboxydocella TaxID=178898 RepID=A0A1T4PJX0_9FIRM|nr:MULTISPECIES: arginine--tRNA ligase [Carboxydocella]AVX19508.1 arginyl-tRNA synthetase [Carboxydocella thermautotrophica]SJZ91850.1 arginyl-tRNA synthetase [Carboxydocella sporoproducens DSM 16521]